MLQRLSKEAFTDQLTGAVMPLPYCAPDGVRLENSLRLAIETAGSELALVVLGHSAPLRPFLCGVPASFDGYQKAQQLAAEISYQACRRAYARSGRKVTIGQPAAKWYGGREAYRERPPAAYYAHLAAVLARAADEDPPRVNVVRLQARAARALARVRLTAGERAGAVQLLCDGAAANAPLGLAMLQRLAELGLAQLENDGYYRALAGAAYVLDSLAATDGAAAAPGGATAGAPAGGGAETTDVRAILYGDK